MLGLTAFISTQTIVDKWSALLAFSAAAAVLAAIGLTIARFKNWRLKTGMMLLFSCLAVCSVMFVILAAPATPIMAGAGNIMQLKDFGDYQTGGTILFLLLTTSCVLVIRHTRISKLKNRIAELKQRIQRL
ncbi:MULTISPECIES: hypothetical protein [Neisseria]|nr:MULTISPECIES: hypothetical protein [Neisseria]MBF0804375.1 hypothetical protein [Neisseria sp. 19428wB4_WF04]TFU42855.1 hypothetical protein E4T99_08490 [Neisseria sp. WF04]